MKLSAIFGELFLAYLAIFVSSTYDSSGTVGIVCYAHSALNLVRAHLVSTIFLCRLDDSRLLCRLFEIVGLVWPILASVAV